MAHFEKRKNRQNEIVSYCAQIRLAGFQPESKNFKKLSEAKRWATIRENLILEGRQTVEEKSARYTAREIIDRYIQTVLPVKTAKQRSKDMQLQQLRTWKSEIGNFTLNNITPAFISEIRDEFAKTRKPSTVNRYLACLSHVFTKAFKEWELIHENPFKKVQMMKEPRGRVKFLTDNERIKILAAAAKDEILYLFIIMALSTGARKSEILNLKWEDIDLRINRAVLQDTKNNDRRSVFFFAAAEAALKERFKNRRKGFQFVFATRRHDVPVDIYPAWYKMKKALKLKDFRIHDLRHCYATELAKNGASLNDLAELLGHKTLNMVKRYAHLLDSPASTMVKKMNENMVIQNQSCAE